MLTFELTTEALSTDGVPALAFRRGSNRPLAFRFTRNGVTVELDEGATLAVQVNMRNARGGTGLASGSALERVERGEGARYAIPMDFTGQAITDAMSDGAVSVPVDLQAKLTMGGSVYVSEILATTIHNTVFA